MYDKFRANQMRFLSILQTHVLYFKFKHFIMWKLLISDHLDIWQAWKVQCAIPATDLSKYFSENIWSNVTSHRITLICIYINIMYLFSSSVGGFLFCGATSCSASSATAIANYRGCKIANQLIRNNTKP